MRKRNYGPSDDEVRHGDHLHHLGPLIRTPEATCLLHLMLKNEALLDPGEREGHFRYWASRN
jgi:hypothetical protein